MALLPGMQGGAAFDATQVDPAKAFDPLPAGWYIVKIVESETKPTSKQDGQMLVLTLEVMEPSEFSGRKLFDRLNLQNQNQIAQEIAWKTLSAICHATKTIQITDSAQLHGKPMKAKVSVRSAQKGADGNDYDATNDVKGYKSVDDANGAPALPPGAVLPPNGGGPPWAGATPASVPAAVVQPPPPPPPSKWPLEAIEWAKANPTHPEAIPILESLPKPAPIAASSGSPPWAKGPAAVPAAQAKPPWAK